MKQVQSWYSGLSTPAKFAVAGGAAFLVWKAGKAIFSNDKSGGTTDQLPPGQGTKTFTDSEYAILADGIETAVWGTDILGVWSEDDSAIGDILMLMETTADVVALNNAYGVRTRGVVLTSGGNLVQTVTSYLDADVKEDVNADYRDKGIQWIWP
jgi:Ca2+-binding RTX toxin-like protein